MMRTIKHILKLTIIAVIFSMLMSGCIGHEHRFSTSWTKDEKYHWHAAVCEHTDERIDEAEHSYNIMNKCTVCGYQHEHQYAESWESDESGHWHEVLCGHEVKVNVYEHDYDETYRCTECGYQHEHTWKDQICYDEEAHWYEYTCGHKREQKESKEAHEFDENYKCKICGYQHEHKYNTRKFTVDDTAHWHAAICGHDAERIDYGAHHYNEDYVCTRCGYQHEHRRAENWTIDENFHWLEAECGHPLKEAHFYRDGVCECGQKEPEGETDGLRYTESVEGYIVTGIGTASSRYIRIPERYEGKKVIEIAANAFKGNRGIANIIIPKWVKKIGQSAFEGCTELVQLEFAKESELKELGDGEWQGNVCKDCKSLREIRLPEGLEKIWDNSFQGCTQLEEVYIPSTVTLLRYGIFSECANISRVEFHAILAGKAMYDNLFRVAFKSKEKEIYFDYAGTLEEWKEFVLYDTHNISKRMWRETDGSSRHDTIYIRCSDGLIYKFTTNDTSTLEETSETLEADWDWTKSYEPD